MADHSHQNADSPISDPFRDVILLLLDEVRHIIAQLSISSDMTLPNLDKSIDLLTLSIIKHAQVLEKVFEARAEVKQLEMAVDTAIPHSGTASQSDAECIRCLAVLSGIELSILKSIRDRNLSDSSTTNQPKDGDSIVE